MIFAARKLQNIGLILLLTICALIVYPVSLQVSATQSELRRVEQRIADVRLRNRMIEGDIAVVANVSQLDRWNRDMIGYVAPAPGQYLSGERAIASLDRLRPLRGIDGRAEVRFAAADTESPAIDDDEDVPSRRIDTIASADVTLIPAGALR